MKQGCGGEGRVVFLRYILHRHRSSSEAAGLLCQCSSNLGWSIGEDTVPADYKLGAQGASIQGHKAMGV